METKDTSECKPNELQRVKLKLKDLISKQLSTEDFVPINPHEIRNYIYYGFSDACLRPSYWKVLLNYYSTNKFKSEQFYKQARQAYNDILTGIDPNDKEIEKISRVIMAEVERTDYTTSEKESIARILTVFSIVSPGIGYVQGMVSLAHVFYHVLYRDEHLDSARFAEEDAFYLFNNLVSELSNLFIDEFDNQKQGIKHKVNEVFEVIRERDPELYEALRSKSLLKTMFPLRWVLLLFSTEYPVDKTVWLWDRILSDSSRFEIIVYCAAAVIVLMRNAIIKESYDECLNILQKPSIISPELMFDIADTMRRDSRDINEIIREKIASNKDSQTPSSSMTGK